MLVVVLDIIALAVVQYIQLAIVLVLLFEASSSSSSSSSSGLLRIQVPSLCYRTLTNAAAKKV